MGKILMKAPRTEAEKGGCESCHGPGSRHVAALQNGDPVAGTILSFRADASESATDVNGACLQCHERGDQAYWRGSAHESRGLTCTSCHSVMAKSPERGQLKAADGRSGLNFRRATTEVCLGCHPDQRAQLQRSSHMPLREGKLTCASCHNPHGSATEALLKDNSVNESCYRCHAEKRGPFLWEHAPVRENCLTCHEAHGSINEALLTVKQPRLCQQCHMESTHAASAFDARSRFVFNRSCANCHPQVHGSNHPSGVRLQR
jgi:DmsE family decaheme c-type cytochrome